MEKKDKLFIEILSALNSNGILKEFILIGGWCQRIYRYHFNNPPELSAMRTADIDLVLINPNQIRKEIDISKIFESLDFEEEIFMPNGHIKYVHPDLEIELLVPAVGTCTDTPFPIKKLNSNAQRLRYLDIIENHTKEIEFFGLKVIVPEPAAFVINKFIVSGRRKDPQKQHKDLTTAKEFGEYILNDPEQKKLLKSIFNSLHPRIQKTLLIEVQKTSPEIYLLLNKL